MSAMAKMFADMIMKELPEEIREALTPENLQKVTERVTQFLGFTRGALEHIVTEQQEQRVMLETIMEKLNNDNGSGGGRRAKRIAPVNGTGSEPDAGT